MPGSPADRRPGRAGARRTPAVATDAELVALVQAGDVDAFEQLARREGDRLYRVALRVVGNRHDAEEAVQETLLQAWRSMDRFRGDSALSTWLHRICVNCCLMAVRRRKETAEVPEGLASTELGPAETAELRLDIDSVAQVLRTLPEDQRVAVVLRDFADLSYQEVADVTGASLTAARSRIHRARLAIVGRLADRDRADEPGSEGVVA